MSSFAEQLQATKRNKATTANGGYPATFSSEDVRDITNELSHMYSKDSAYETKESVHIANSGAFHSSNDGHDGHAPHPTTKADSGLSNSSVDRQERIESTRSQNSQNEDLTREDSRVKLRSKVSNIQNPVRNTASGFKDHYRNRESLTMASNIYASKKVKHKLSMSKHMSEAERLAELLSHLKCYEYQMEVELQKETANKGNKASKFKKSFYGIVVKRVKGTGLFVALVSYHSLAERAGIRFGDMIVEIDDVDTIETEMRSVDASHAITHNDSVRLTVRKPLTLVLQREEVDVSWGFGIRNGVISSEIEPDSPAALANLPPDHAILSVNGNEVICLSDEELKKVLQKAGHELRVKLRHVTVYRELLRSVGLSLKSSSKRMYGMFPVNTEKKEIVSKFEKILDPRPKGIKDDRNFRVLKEGYIVKELESAESSSEE